jgi:predicted esterase
VDLAREARDQLTQTGIAVRYHEFSMGHEISLDSLAIVRAFLYEVLGLEPVA